MSKGGNRPERHVVDAGSQRKNPMPRIVTALFKERAQAQQGLQALMAAGIAQTRITTIGLNEGGRDVSSISGYGPSLRTPAYAAVKALLINYTQSQAAMFAPDGIRVNGVAPGSIEFPGGSWEKRRTEDPALYSRIKDSIPFGRLGTPEEVANVVLFLASPLAGWVTGHTVIVDGGQLLG